MCYELEMDSKVIKRLTEIVVFIINFFCFYLHCLLCLFLSCTLHMILILNNNVANSILYKRNLLKVVV